MNPLHKRLNHLEEAKARMLPPPRRIDWMCARLPANASLAIIERLTVEAEALGGNFHGYVYDGPPSFLGEIIPELYQLHTLQQMPSTYVDQEFRRLNAERS